MKKLGLSRGRFGSVKKFFTELLTSEEHSGGYLEDLVL